MNVIKAGITTALNALAEKIVTCGWGIYDLLKDRYGMTPTEAASFINEAAPELWDAMSGIGDWENDDDAKPAETVWQALFGTPERAAETLAERERACTGTHVGVACFGYENCNVCPLSNGLCTEHSDEVDMTSSEAVLALLMSDYRKTHVTECRVYGGDE